MQLIVTTRDGSEQIIEASVGKSIMQNIRDAGLDELVALCGGCLSCATCHIYIDPSQPGLPAMSQDEDDLLDSSSARTTESRLSCQLPFVGALAGSRVTIAPED